MDSVDYKAASVVKTKAEKIVVTLKNLRRVKAEKLAKGEEWLGRSPELLALDVDLIDTQLKIINQLYEDMVEIMDQAQADSSKEAEQQDDTKPNANIYVCVRHPDLKGLVLDKLKDVRNLVVLLDTVRRIGSGGSLSIYPTAEAAKQFISSRSMDRNTYGFVEVCIDPEVYEQALNGSNLTDSEGEKRIDRSALNVKEFRRRDIGTLYAYGDGKYPAFAVTVDEDGSFFFERRQ